jgi:4-aminobutyrate aminotransferase-like enzyme
MVIAAGGRVGSPHGEYATMPKAEESRSTWQARVLGDLPGPRSAELLAVQERRESNARVYGRHFPIAVEEALGSFLRDVDGNVFIDFLLDAITAGTARRTLDVVSARG